MVYVGFNIMNSHGINPVGGEEVVAGENGAGN